LQKKNVFDRFKIPSHRIDAIEFGQRDLEGVPSRGSWRQQAFHRRCKTFKSELRGGIEDLLASLGPFLAAGGEFRGAWQDPFCGFLPMGVPDCSIRAQSLETRNQILHVEHRTSPSTIDQVMSYAEWARCRRRPIPMLGLSIRGLPRAAACAVRHGRHPERQNPRARAEVAVAAKERGTSLISLYNDTFGVARRSSLATQLILMSKHILFT